MSIGLQLVFLGVNLIGTFSFVLLSPMILARTGENELILGSVLSAGAIGGVVGGGLLSAWGGPRRKIHGVLISMTLMGLLGDLVLGLGRGLIVWALAAFILHAIIPVLNGSNQAIWQAKVPPDVQGRVFATRVLIAQAAVPLAMLVAGPLADRVFEPAMQFGGSLAPIFGWLVGVEPGSGMSLMFVFAGIFGGAIGLFGYLFRPVRQVEDLLPDHETDAMATVESVAAESAATA